MDTGTLVLAIATFSMAGATLFMAIKTRRSAKATEDLADQNRQLVKANEEMVRLTKETLEENHKLAESPRIRELIIEAINPLLKSIKEIKGYHEKREYRWVKPDLEMATELLGTEQASIFQFGLGRAVGAEDAAFYPHPQLTIEENASSAHQLNQALYRDFRKMHPSLAERIEEHDRKAEGFRYLLVDLAQGILSPEFRKGVFTSPESEGIPEGMSAQGHVSMLTKLTLSTACLAFNELLGASERFSYDQVRDTESREFWKKYGDSIMEKLRNSRNIKDKVEQITKEADNFIEELKIIEAELTEVKNRYQKDYHLTHDKTEGEEIKARLI